MATLKHLISFADITARTVVELGSEPHKFNVAIPEAQATHLRPVLGWQLYNDLLNFVQQATPDTTDPLAELAEQVKGMLCAWAVVEAWPFLLGHIEAAGYTTKVGEKTTGTTMADVQLTDRTLSALTKKALFHSDELTNWLLRHQSIYPSWPVPGGPAATLMPTGGMDFD